MPEHIFISYARNDGKDFAEKLHDQLEIDGFKVWLDLRDIKLGEEWDKSIDEAIRTCRALIFLITSGSVASSTCQDEWSRALSFKKQVLPLLLEPINPPLRLHRRQYIDFTSGFDVGIDKLRQHLNWMQSPDGEIQILRDRLADLERELELGYSSRPDAVRIEITNLREQIAYKEQALINPEKIRNEYRHATQVGVATDKKRFVEAREQDRTLIRRRVIGSAPQGISGVFKDRGHEAAEIINMLLKPDDIRALSIYGKGGVGKTALACEVMRDLEKDYTNIYGLIYLSTRSGLGINLERIYLDSARMVGGDSEQALNKTWTDSRSDITAKVQILLEHYGDKRCVILLDNLEDLLDADGRLLDPDLRLFVNIFLRQTHGGRLLITSREPLNPADDVRRYERRFPLEQGLPIDDATALLRELDYDGSLGLATADTASLRVVVDKTHGYPRALEAVAGILARDPLLSLEVLINNEELFAREIIETLVREAQSRLDADERRVMQALAVYNRPVTEAAVRFLLEPYLKGVDVGATLRRLAYGRYIIVKRNTGEIVLHPLDKAYNYRQIPYDNAEPYNRLALERRAADYYVQLRTPRETWKTIADLEPQLVEFEHRIKSQDYDTTAHLMDEIDSDYLTLWGHFKRVLVMRQQLLGKITNARLEGINLRCLGFTFRYLAQYENAKANLDRALQITRRIGDLSEEIKTLESLGKVYADIGQHRIAIEQHKQALAIAKKSGYKVAECEQLISLGLLSYNLGYFKEAVTYYHESLKIAKEVQNDRGINHCLGGLGSAYRSLGQYNDAKVYLEQALNFTLHIGDKRWEGVWNCHLGLLYADLGEQEKAIELYQKAITIARDIGYKRDESVFLIYLALSKTYFGFYEVAINHYLLALEISDAIGDRLWKCIGLAHLGYAYNDLGNHEKALDYLKKTLIIIRDVGDRGEESNFLEGLGHAFRCMGQYEKAIECYNEGLDIANEINAHQTRARHLTGIAEAYIGLRQYDIALTNLSTAIEQTKEYQNPIDQQKRLTSLAQIYLHQRKIPEAIDAVTSAIKYATILNAHRTYCLYGIALLKAGQKESSHIAFQDALKCADNILALTPNYYAAKYSRGLALSGLILSSEKNKDTISITDVMEAYVSAINASTARGVLTDAINILDELILLDDQIRLGALRTFLDNKIFQQTLKG